MPSAIETIGGAYGASRGTDTSFATMFDESSAFLGPCDASTDRLHLLAGLPERDRHEPSGSLVSQADVKPA